MPAARCSRGDIRVGHVAHGLAAELRERGLAYACERHVRVGEHRGPCAQCVERTVRGVMGEHEGIGVREVGSGVDDALHDGLFERRERAAAELFGDDLEAAPLDVAGRHLLGIHLVLHSFPCTYPLSIGVFLAPHLGYVVGLLHDLAGRRTPGERYFNAARGHIERAVHESLVDKPFQKARRASLRRARAAPPERPRARRAQKARFPSCSSHVAGKFLPTSFGP